MKPNLTVCVKRHSHLIVKFLKLKKTFCSDWNLPSFFSKHFSVFGDKAYILLSKFFPDIFINFEFYEGDSESAKVTDKIANCKIAKFEVSD